MLDRRQRAEGIHGRNRVLTISFAPGLQGGLSNWRPQTTKSQIPWSKAFLRCHRIDWWWPELLRSPSPVGTIEKLGQNHRPLWLLKKEPTMLWGNLYIDHLTLPISRCSSLMSFLGVFDASAVSGDSSTPIAAISATTTWSLLWVSRVASCSVPFRTPWTWSSFTVPCVLMRPSNIRRWQ